VAAISGHEGVTFFAIVVLERAEGKLGGIEAQAGLVVEFVAAVASETFRGENGTDLEAVADGGRRGRGISPCRRPGDNPPGRLQKRGARTGAETARVLIRDAAPTS